MRTVLRVGLLALVLTATAGFDRPLVPKEWRVIIGQRPLAPRPIDPSSGGFFGKAPEPGALALLTSALGTLGAAGWVLRRRKK